MKKGRKIEPSLPSDTDYHLFYIEALMDGLLTQALGLPTDVKQAIVSVRHAASKALELQQKRTITH